MAAEGPDPQIIDPAAPPARPSYTSIEQLRGVIPDAWIAEISRWPASFQQQWLDSYTAGDQEAGAKIVADARTAMANQPPVTPPAVDQGKYSQAIDETARADPKSFVGWVLGQQGGDQYGNNPLAASALRKSTLTPYMRELQMNGYQNAPLYNYADYLENWTRNNNAPGIAGGGNGTAFSFNHGTDALKALVARGTNPNNLEFDTLHGGSVDDSVNTLKTYTAAAYADSLDPTYQRASQDYIDRKKQDYMGQVYGQNDSGSDFIDWYQKNGFKYDDHSYQQAA